MAGIIDSHGRTINYLRISITDRCNFRCFYCMPPEGVKQVKHEEIMRYEEIIKICSLFKELGIRKIRFTGGEPFVRKGFALFLNQVRRKFKDLEITLTTNGFFLEENAEEVVKANIDSLNISLDTLNRAKFYELTKVDGLEKIIAGIKKSVKLGIKNIKINTVLMKDINDTEVHNLLEFSKKEGVLLRLIEFMPLQDCIWKKKHFISSEEIFCKLNKKGEWIERKEHKAFEGPAKYFTNKETGQVIGIISSVSNHFCQSCNRLRISATGNMRNCLYSTEELPLRTLIKHKDLSEVKKIIIDEIKNKPNCWKDVRSGENIMSAIGG